MTHEEHGGELKMRSLEQIVADHEPHPKSLKDQESKEAYNEEAALKDFGEWFRAYLVRSQHGFCGDWWQFALLKRVLKEDEQCASIKNEDRLAVWNDWRKIFKGSLPHQEAYELIHLERAILHFTHLEGADLCFAHLETADLQEAKLDDANLHYAHLAGASLLGAHLQGTQIEGAYLENANLQRARLERANLFKAHLEKADLRFADLSNAVVGRVTYDRRTMKFQGIRVATCYGHALFKRDAQDQDWIEAFRSQSGWNYVKYLLWAFFTDCGRSLFRVGFLGASLAIFFGCIYARDPTLLDVSGAAQTWWTPYYYSIVTFTTLGFGDVTPATLAGEFWVCAEVLVGYMMLGLLVSILANKVARRS